MANLNAMLPVWVVYKIVKKRKKEELVLKCFENTRVDDIINGNKRTPIIPNEYEILEIGVGNFEEKYRQKYKIYEKVDGRRKKK